MAFSVLHHHYIISTKHLSIHGFFNPYIVEVAIIFLLCVQQLKATERKCKNTLHVTQRLIFYGTWDIRKMTASMIHCNRTASLGIHAFIICIIYS